MYDLFMFMQVAFYLGALIVLVGLALLAGGFLIALPVAFVFGVCKGLLDRIEKRGRNQ